MKILLTMLLLCLSLTANGEVYKRTLPDGTVEFTDQPANADDEPVKLPPLNRVPATPIRVQQPKDEPAVDAYQSLAITSPEDGATFTENAGNVTVKISIEPGLQTDHQLELKLDGAVIKQSQASSITLENVDRGSHTLRASVVDAKGKTLITSDSIRFNLRRRSVLTQPAPGAPPSQIRVTPQAPRAPGPP